MVLKVSVGLSKKVGMPDYGSLGASCHVEVELDGTFLWNDLDRFQQQVRQAYLACAQAINDELVRQRRNGAAADGSGKALDTRKASEKQLDYAQRLAGQIKGLGTRRLECLAQKMFQKPHAELSCLEASGLIDTLKEIKEGKITLEAMNWGAS